MEYGASLDDQAVVGHFLCEGMFEGVLQVWKCRPLINEFARLQMREAN